MEEELLQEHSHCRDPRERGKGQRECPPLSSLSFSLISCWQLSLGKPNLSQKSCDDALGRGHHQNTERGSGKQSVWRIFGGTGKLFLPKCVQELIFKYEMTMMCDLHMMLSQQVTGWHKARDQHPHHTVSPR